MSKEKAYRYFKLYKLNNKDVQFGRVKISRKSGKPLDAAKKLLNSICEYKGLTKNNKLKCKAHFYIRETTKDSKKRIYGPYKGSFKKYDKPVIIKLDNGREIKHKMYAEVIKIKGEKKIIQSGGYGPEWVINLGEDIINCALKLTDGIIVTGGEDGIIRKYNVVMRENNVVMTKENVLMTKSNDRHNDEMTESNVMTKSNDRHNDEVTCLLQMTDGRLVSGSKDGNLKIWNIETLHCDSTLKGNSDSTLKRNSDSMNFIIQVNNNNLVTCNLNTYGKTELKIWDIGTKKFTLKEHLEIKRSNKHKLQKDYYKNNKITCLLRVDHDHFMSGSKTIDFLYNGGWDPSPDSNLKTWSVRTGEYKKNIMPTETLNCSLKLSDGSVVLGGNKSITAPQDSFLMTFSDNLLLTSTSSISNTTNKSVDWSSSYKMNYEVNCLLQLENGNIVTAGNEFRNNSLILWDIDNKCILRKIQLSRGGIVTYLLEVSPNYIVAGNTFYFEIFDISLKTSIGAVEGKNIICLLKLSENKLMSCCKDSLTVWNIEEIKKQVSLIKNRKNLYNLRKEKQKKMLKNCKKTVINTLRMVNKTKAQAEYNKEFKNSNLIEKLINKSTLERNDKEKYKALIIGNNNFMRNFGSAINTLNLPKESLQEQKLVHKLGELIHGKI